MAKYCSNCGKVLNEGAKFCDGCGKAISIDQPPEQQSPQQQRVQQLSAGRLLFVIIGLIAFVGVMVGLFVTDNTTLVTICVVIVCVMVVLSALMGNKR